MRPQGEQDNADNNKASLVSHRARIDLGHPQVGGAQAPPRWVVVTRGVLNVTRGEHRVSKTCKTILTLPRSNSIKTVRVLKSLTQEVMKGREISTPVSTMTTLSTHEARTRLPTKISLGLGETISGTKGGTAKGSNIGGMSGDARGEFKGVRSRARHRR